MAGVNETDLSAGASPAPIPRIFGWGMLAVMSAFLLNIVLTYWVGLPGSAAAFHGGGALSWAQLAIWVVLPLWAVAHVLRSPDTALRAEAKSISDFNATVIRCAFWVVVLVGLADAVVSFMRVEGFLPAVFGDDMALNLGKSEFRGHWVHIPAALIGIAIGVVTRPLSFIWLALLVVMAELAIVFSRFIFSYEQAFMSDLVRFWYAALFLFSSAYTLLEDGHVRVDVLYSNFRRTSQGRVNSIGSIFLGMTLCWTILLIGMGSKSAIIVGPILIYETTQTGFGMYVKYIMAGYLGVFAITMLIQFVSMFLDSVADWRGEPGGEADHHAGAIG